MKVQGFPVRATPDLVDDAGFEVEEDGARDVLAGASLGEEGGEAVIVVRGGAGQGSVGEQTVLQTVEIPTGVPHLNSCPRIAQLKLFAFGFFFVNNVIAG